MSLNADKKRDGEVGEGSQAFTLTDPISPALLDEQLGSPGLVIEGNPAEASSKNPVTMWVVGETDLTSRQIAAKVKAHEIPENPEDVLVDLREKALDGEDLSPEEIQVAVRMLLLRS